MKSKVLFLFVNLLVSVVSTAQATLFVPSPLNNGSTTGVRAPNGTAAQTTLRAHFIIPATELTGVSSGTIITDIGFTAAVGSNVAATGNLEFYVENTSDVINNKSSAWATAIGTMANVYSGNYNTPLVPGLISFTNTNTFTYTGGGLYVAYEYIGTAFATTGATYLANNSMAGSCMTGATGGAIPLDTLNSSSSFRPEIQFGFSNPYTNDISVNSVSTDFGKLNMLHHTSADFEVVIQNNSNVDATNVPVDLIVSGASSYSSSQNISLLTAGSTTVLNFSAIPATVAGLHHVKVYVPNDQQPNNDSIIYPLSVNCDTLSYTSNAPQSSGVGFNTGSGILAVKYTIPTSLPQQVKTINIDITDGVSNTGNTIKGLLLDDSGVIQDSTNVFTITAGNLGTSISLNFIGGSATYQNEDIFVGFRQYASIGAGYFPCGTQAPPTIADSANCSFGVNGGTATYYTTLGAFMIGANLQAQTPISFININGDLCSGSTANIGVFPSGFDNYSLFMNTIQSQSSTVGSFNVSPTSNSNVYVEAETNSCTYTSNSLFINVVTEFQSSINATICTGDSYDFYGQSISIAGQYIETVVVPGSCDTVVTLDLFVAQHSASTIAATICEGSTYQFDNSTLSAEGTYTAVIPNTAGCDSTITLNLSFHPIDMTITQNAATLTVAESGVGVSYQWVDCNNNNTPISGETNQSFTPTVSMGIVGDYAVSVTKDSCTMTSDCITVDFTGLENDINLTLSVYPIPVVDVLNISTNLKQILSYTIYDMNGKIVLNTVISNLNLNEINVSELQSGTYLLELNTSGNSAKKVFVKQ